jgi:serine/threonine-protein kinase
MGRVYRAFDQKIEEEVALKLIRPEVAADKRTVERFRNEIKTARKITHKNVCRMHDMGEEGKSLFITMEYVRGEDLKSLIRQTRTLTVGTAVSIARQVAEGLGEAHRLGVVHRDLKPGNIMIDKEGNAKIMDFGIARSLARAGTTAEGALIGTPEYMSPEQAEGMPADTRADIYALGVVLFEMVTGRPPFGGETSLAIAHKHKYEHAPDPRTLNPEVPEDLSRVILRCLEKEREARYQTTAELLTDLGSVERASPATANGSVELSGTKRKPNSSKTITVNITPKKLLIPATALVAVAAIVFGLIRFLPKKEAGSPLSSKHSVAVLPFVDMTPEKNYEYLADGISDALINALSRIQDLHVPGRTSAFFFKGRELDVHDIGQKLNVKTVLEGSVQVMGDRLRVVAQLVSTEDGFQLWSDKYDRKLESVFAIQDDIARAIVGTLKIEILGDKNAALVKPATKNLEAYNLYLQGRFFYNKRGKENLQKSEGFYEKAIEMDPTYALAYAGLAETIRILAGNSYSPAAEAYPKAKEIIKKALELDDKISEAYSASACVKRDFDWDFAGAEGDYKRAIELSPDDANIYHQYAILLSILGRHEEAIKEVKLARDLDPLAPRIRANVGWILYCARKYDEALEVLNKELQFDANHWATYEYLGYTYAKLERYAESEESFKMAIGLEDHPNLSIGLALTYARAGRTEEARKLLYELNDRAKKEYVSPAVLATPYGGLGERDVAFVLLDKAYAERDNRITYLSMEPIYDPLRSDPRFDALLQEIGFKK